MKGLKNFSKKIKEKIESGDIQKTVTEKVNVESMVSARDKLKGKIDASGITEKVKSSSVVGGIQKGISKISRGEKSILAFSRTCSERYIEIGEIVTVAIKLKSRYETGVLDCIVTDDVPSQFELIGEMPLMEYQLSPNEEKEYQYRIRANVGGYFQTRAMCEIENKFSLDDIPSNEMEIYVSPLGIRMTEPEMAQDQWKEIGFILWYIHYNPPLHINHCQDQSYIYLVYLDIPSPEIYLITFLFCLLTDTPLTVRYIFEDNHNWGAFCLAEKENLRDVEIKEVNKMLSCKDESRGFFTYRCEHCGTTLIVHFGCNSRICSNCGKNHTDKWAKSLQNALFNVPHRHAVLTIPDALWHIVRNNRFLLKVLMDAAIAAINDTISRKHRNGRLTAGAVVVLHPFSRSMGFNPHLHILVTEGGFDRHDNFIRQKFIPYGVLRKTWQYQVLTRFKAALPKEAVYSVLINRLFQEYPKGFYVHLPKESRITNKKRIAKYVARYIRHPAVANTRLHRYDGKTVTFWYGDHDGKRNFVTMTVREFIKALIQHIPDRNFKMIRYYGAYSRRTKRRYSEYLQRSLKQATFDDFLKNPNKWAPTCPNCGEKMTFVYYEKGPPKENEVFGCKLPDWNHPMLSQSYN